jgi:hypothetical protein
MEFLPSFKSAAASCWRRVIDLVEGIFDIWFMTRKTFERIRDSLPVFGRGDGVEVSEGWPARRA